MKVYTKEILIEALKDVQAQGWILISQKRKRNDGGIGNTIEDLLGIDENNLPLPNAAEWELKTQKKDTTALLTLFHLEPSPRALKFVPNILLPEFGWKHKNLQKKYPSTELSFRQTISSKAYSNRGFIVQVDQKQKKVLIHFSPKQIDKKEHSDWYKTVCKKKLYPQPYWGFGDLCHKAGTKLTNCFYILAQTKRIHKQKYVAYEEIYMLENFSHRKFITAIEDGKIFIDFDARTGHNHGTKFRLRANAWMDLYEKVTEIR